MGVGIAVVQAFLDHEEKYTPTEKIKIAGKCDSCISMFSLDARAVSSSHLSQLDRTPLRCSPSAHCYLVLKLLHVIYCLSLQWLFT
ncbi:hypothetical protein KIN20_028963 [Parelaphostrongylus tenuis]|uniref:Uncharacterized protein n=1 Tax=Parelaphostrongylus tenuis TaxID=148309 RepID=A0AAD5R2C5_PARTN|nr:hypothetical protein KIN20_028963 [Parelaphostrongylus tenuis]